MATTGDTSTAAGRLDGDRRTAEPAVVLFTRDLRVRDNPALRAAARGAGVVPLFVLDEAILAGGQNRPNRMGFLAESLADLDASLRERGAGLVVRRGDVVEVVARVAADAGAPLVHVAADVSGYAQSRERRLADRLAVDGRHLQTHADSLFVAPPGVIHAVGKEHMDLYLPYLKKWLGLDRRRVLPAPTRLTFPPGTWDEVGRGWLPTAGDSRGGDASPGRLPGGEKAARDRLTRWLRRDVGDLDRMGGDLAADATSRLSAYLHFGCLSPVELAERAGVERPHVLRQLALRDFCAQLLAAHPDAVRIDLRPRDDQWIDDDEVVTAWKEGRTGYPMVDAAMRQLRQEGWMPPGARWFVGHFLTKTLYQDWRIGARHFADLLTDGDVASNTINWQLVGGVGIDFRFNRVYDPTKQGLAHDPTGDYVRRYVPELAGVAGPAVHRPWRLSADQRASLRYPEPVVDAAEGNRRFQHARGVGRGK